MVRRRLPLYIHSMLSLVKIIFTVAVIYAVWFIFKYRRRIAAAHKHVMDEKAKAAAAAAAARTPSVPANTKIAQDLVACPKCGSYIAAGTTCSCQKT